MPKSNKPAALFFLSLTPSLRASFKKQVARFVDATIVTTAIEDHPLPKDTEILGVFVDSKVTKEMLESLPKLRLIVSFSTGVDHIDIKAAKKRNIVVANVPSYGEVTVAEHALTLMLALSKNLFPAVKRVKEGEYDYHGLRGFDLEGKTVGIVGTGRIGSHLAKLLHAFGCTILAFDLYKNEEIVNSYGVQYVSKSTLFSGSDIVSLHLPLLDSTRHIVDRAAIKKMKKGVHIINTARGGLIDAKALVWGLESGIVGGAGLDVLEDENMLEDPLLFCGTQARPESAELALLNNMLIDHPKVIVTPHSAFNTTEAVGRILSTTAQNVASFLAGEPTNLVT